MISPGHFTQSCRCHSAHNVVDILRVESVRARCDTRCPVWWAGGGGGGGGRYLYAMLAFSDPPLLPPLLLLD